VFLSSLSKTSYVEALQGDQWVRSCAAGFLKMGVEPWSLHIDRPARRKPGSPVGAFGVPLLDEATRLAAVDPGQTESE
jgi:hypothetical protein